jgi:hypothetical protein
MCVALTKRLSHVLICFVSLTRVTNSCALHEISAIAGQKSEKESTKEENEAENSIVIYGKSSGVEKRASQRRRML